MFGGHEFLEGWVGLIEGGFGFHKQKAETEVPLGGLGRYLAKPLE